MLKMRLITALFALMITFGMMNTAHAQEEQLPLISVEETTDSLEALAAAGVETIITSNQEYVAKVLVKAQKPLKNFRILSIEYTPNSDPNDTAIRFKIKKTIYSRDTLTPDTTLCSVVEMLGSIPNTAYSYTTEDGTSHAFSLGASGEDGHLYLSPIETINQ